MTFLAFGWFLLLAAGVVVLLFALIVWIVVGMRWLRLHPVAPDEQPRPSTTPEA